jgi:hypothetical protein
VRPNELYEPDHPASIRDPGLCVGTRSCEHVADRVIVISVPNAKTAWRAHLIACTLFAAALTAFLMHLGAADPWIGGIAVPAMVWFAWVAVDIARASRRRVRDRRAAQ